MWNISHVKWKYTNWLSMQKGQTYHQGKRGKLTIKAKRTNIPSRQKGHTYHQGKRGQLIINAKGANLPSRQKGQTSYQCKRDKLVNNAIMNTCFIFIVIFIVIFIIYAHIPEQIVTTLYWICKYSRADCHYTVLDMQIFQSRLSLHCTGYAHIPERIVTTL